MVKGIAGGGIFTCRLPVNAADKNKSSSRYSPKHIRQTVPRLGGDGRSDKSSRKSQRAYRRRSMPSGSPRPTCIRTWYAGVAGFEVAAQVARTGPVAVVQEVRDEDVACRSTGTPSVEVRAHVRRAVVVARHAPSAAHAPIHRRNDQDGRPGRTGGVERLVFAEILDFA